MTPTNEPDNDELRGLLREMGRAGERLAPAFQRVWRAAQEAREPASHWHLGWAAAAVVLVLCTFSLLNREPGLVIEADAEIDDALPTNFLLTTYNDNPVERLADEISAVLRP